MKILQGSQLTRGDAQPLEGKNVRTILSKITPKTA
jgi:hypothetical protein